ncbi:hypothetical protein TNCV_2048061 [Trichonephila clavipes]|nr:hypothetical protein TNCV_2048061 [Trichonephila clavipes]
MSSVFGDCSQQGLSPAHTQEPHLLDTVPFLFDESNDLISFLDNFETGLAIEQQETPMDLTMPRMEKKQNALELIFEEIPTSYGKGINKVELHMGRARDCNIGPKVQ